MSNRPTEQEYSAYYGRYVSYVPEVDIVAALEASGKYANDVFGSFTEDQASTLHGTTNWTLKQTLAHLNDAERVFSYRAMWIARGDKTPLPSFDQDAFMLTSNADARTWESLVAENSALRRATIELARSFTPEMMQQVGTASDNKVSARALLYITVGHERRHIELIKEQSAKH